jgi:hypothetical protein
MARYSVKQAAAFRQVGLGLKKAYAWLAEPGRDR